MPIPYNEEMLNEAMQKLYDKAEELYIEEYNTEDNLEETLNDIYGEVEICGTSFQQGSAFKELDPIAFRCELSNNEDNLREVFDQENDIEDFRDKALESLNMEDEE